MAQQLKDAMKDPEIKQLVEQTVRMKRVIDATRDPRDWTPLYDKFFVPWMKKIEQKTGINYRDIEKQMYGLVKASVPTKGAKVAALRQRPRRAKRRTKAAGDRVVPSPGRGVALEMQQWHSSMMDPIYQASSTWFAGKDVPEEIAIDARDSLESLIEDAEAGKHGWTEDDAASLSEMVSAIDKALKKAKKVKASRKVVAARQFFVVVADGDPNESYAGESLEEALDAAMFDSGTRYTVYKVMASDAGDARMPYSWKKGKVVKKATASTRKRQRKHHASFKGAVPGNLSNNTKPSTLDSQMEAVELLKQGGILPEDQKPEDYPVLTAKVKREIIATLLRRKQPKLATWASRNLVTARKRVTAGKWFVLEQMHLGGFPSVFTGKSLDDVVQQAADAGMEDYHDANVQTVDAPNAKEAVKMIEGGQGDFVDEGKVKRARKKVGASTRKRRPVQAAKNYASVVFLQNDFDFNDFRGSGGKGQEGFFDSNEKEMMKYLQQWDYGDNYGDVVDPMMQKGTNDYVYKAGRYLMTYNPGLGYAGLYVKA